MFNASSKLTTDTNMCVSIPTWFFEVEGNSISIIEFVCFTSGVGEKDFLKGEGKPDAMRTWVPS